MEEKRAAGKRFNAFFLESWHPYFWLCLACIFLYLKTLAFRFTYADDDLIILNNFWFLRDFGNIFRCFRESVSLGGGDYFYRPMLLISFMIDAHVGGTSPIVYHLTNILLHAAASALLFLLFVKLSYGRKLAFFISMLFMVHPALSQAVAWIPGRNDSLLAVFAVTSFIFYIDFVETSKLRDLLLSLLFFNLAIYTKESAVMLIPAGVLYLWLVAEKKLTPRQTYAAGAVFSFTIFIWAFIRHLSSTQRLAFQDVKSYLSDVLPGVLQYLGKIIFPFNLSVYPLVQGTTLLYGVAAVLLTAAALLATPGERLKRSFFGLAWFFLFILPPFLFPNELRCEHRLYLPIAGYFIVLAGIDWPLFRMPAKLLSAAGALVIIIFAGLAYVNADNFIGRLVFWKSATNSSPGSSNAHYKLALRYHECGEDTLSEKELLKAVELSPANVKAHLNLGVAYTGKGMFKEAERELNTVNALKPDDYLLYYNYGLLCIMEGRDKEAELSWEKTLRLNPQFIWAYRSLAAYNFIRGDRSKFGYYSKQLKDRFSYTVDLPTSTITNKRTWLYLYSTLGT